jgi:putative transposase
VPISHPFVERLIGAIRREYLDRTLFWTPGDLEMKLLDFQRYYTVTERSWTGARRTRARTRAANARTSVRIDGNCTVGLYQTPMAA